MLPRPAGVGPLLDDSASQSPQALATGDTRVETSYGAFPDSLRVETGHVGVTYPRTWRGGLVFSL